MKIPLDFFLRLMQNFLNDIELSSLANQFDDYFEVEEDDYRDVLKGVSLKEIIVFFINSNEKLKKRVKEKVKKLAQEENGEDQEEALTSLKKKKKREVNKPNENEDDEEEEEEKEKPIKKPKKEPKPQSKEKEEEIDLNKLEFKSIPKQNLNPERKPFKRVDDSIKQFLPEALKDNSYEAFMKKTGDNFGQEANEKLKYTKGKDFKKEKGKFKNKSSAGAYEISTTVRSIPLEDNSD